MWRSGLARDTDDGFKWGAGNGDEIFKAILVANGSWVYARGIEQILVIVTCFFPKG